MEQGRLSAPENRVDTGDLPLADCPVLVVAHVVPVEARSVRHVHHAVILFGRPALLLQQLPGAIEELGGERALVAGGLCVRAR